MALFLSGNFFLVALLRVTCPMAYGKAYGNLFFDYLNMLNLSSLIMENVPHDPVAHLVALFSWWRFFSVALFTGGTFTGCRSGGSWEGLRLFVF